MKNFTLAFSLVLALLFSAGADAVFAASAPIPVSPQAVHHSALKGMTMKDFLMLTPKSYKALTGKKMSLKERFALKLTQHKVKRELKNNPDFDISSPLPAPEIFDTSDFSWPALLLGLVPVIGILIAYLTDNNTIIKWAWVGTGIVLLILLLFLIF
ncbi:MAG TPA: hypothetical protein VK628_03125 [Flavitalea sp.]|jgi:hypothetical protein|nr:hypothetical protein [Flavitalea sp.]